MAESDASRDEQLELKKRARRRLVGATALALLAAIVLPMVMDREPRPPAQDIQIRIPSQDGSEFVSRLQPTKPAQEVKSVSEPVSAAKPAPEAKPEAKAEAKPEAKPEAAKPAPAAAPAVAKSAEKAPDKPAEKPAEKAAEKPAEMPAPAAKAADKKTEEARAAEALSGGAEAWVVQLGAYKEAGNVKLLVAKLKGMGVPAYTEKFDSPHGTRTRVRAGPFPSKEAAEKARAKIKVVGVDGPVAPK